MSLSISVSAPVMTRFTCLSCSREIWRTTRASLSKTWPERDHAHLEDAALHLREVAVERACRRCSSIASSRGSAARVARAIAQAAIAVCTIASSPTMFIRRSSLRMSTRTVWLTERSDSSRARRRASAQAARAGASDAAPSPCSARHRRERRTLAGSRPSAPAAPGPRRRRAGSTALRGGAASTRARCAAAARAGTSSIATLGPASAAPELAERRAARHEDLELDGVDVRARARRQVRDDLAVRPRACLELVERAVDRRERELHADPVEPQALLDVGAEPVLLVLGEHAEEPGIEIVLRDDARAVRPRARCEVCPSATSSCSTSARRLGDLALLGGEDAAVELTDRKSRSSTAASSSMRPRRRSSSTSSSSCESPAMRVAPKRPRAP